MLSESNQRENIPDSVLKLVKVGKMHIHNKPQQLTERKRSNYFTTASGMTTSCLLQVKGKREESTITLLLGL